MLIMYFNIYGEIEINQHVNSTFLGGRQFGPHS